MPIRSLLSAGAAAGVLLLAGCATPTANVASVASVANPGATVGAYRDTIDLSGRLTANWLKDGQPNSINGVTFEWSQRPGRIDVSLANPFGQTIAEISVTPESATLNQGNQPPRVAKDIDALTAQALGWSLPVSGLRDWMQGYALDAQGRRFVASPSNNSVVTSDGWRLRYVSWQEQPKGASGAPMPKRIDASRGSQASGDALDIYVILNPAG